MRSLNSDDEKRLTWKNSLSCFPGFCLCPCEWHGGSCVRRKDPAVSDFKSKCISGYLPEASDVWSEPT